MYITKFDTIRRTQMQYILYNPLSGHGKSKENAVKILETAGEGSKLINMVEIGSYPDFFATLASDDEIVICGGDGTLNRFINAVKNVDFQNRVLYFPSGNGNDFYTDIQADGEKKCVDITAYIKGLPTVTVNGEEYKFINGVGYGIDGYCCEVGDKLREKGKVANYTAIAIKGLLYGYKPKNATVTVDGVEHKYRKVWIAPTMFGRHYGGGMIPTPTQDRNKEPKRLSLMVFHGSGKLKTLMIFPSIFKGEHVLHEKYIEVIEGNNITVRFDAPSPLQIDGETVLGVTEYTASV